MGEQTDTKRRIELNGNLAGAIKLVGIVLAALMAMVAIGFLPRIDDIQTKTEAREQHEEIQESVDQQWRAVDTKLNILIRAQGMSPEGVIEEHHE